MYVGVVEFLRNLPLYGGGFVLTVNTRLRTRGLSWEFQGIPIQRGFFCIQRGCFGGVSYQDIAKFLIHRALVVGATAIRASPAFEEHRNKGTAYDPSLKSPIDII